MLLIHILLSLVTATALFSAIFLIFHVNSHLEPNVNERYGPTLSVLFSIVLFSLYGQTLVKECHFDGGLVAMFCSFTLLTSIAVANLYRYRQPAQPAL